METSERAALIEAALVRRLEQTTPAVVPRSEPGQAPLSHVQESLWILSQLAGRSATNNRPIKLRLAGHLRIEGLEWALARILERHTILRSTFPLRDESPIQQVQDAPDVRLDPVDVVPADGEELLEAASRLARNHTSRRFDLTSDIPFHPILFRLAPDDHVLAIASHHIVFDGWSEQIFISELATLYDAWCEGDRTSPLPALPIQFADFANWDRTHISTDRLEQKLDFWRQTLADLPPDLNLLADRRIETKLSTPVVLELGPYLRQRIERLANERGATLFMVLSAVLSVLIARHSGQDDFVIGVPTAGRRLVESEPLVGCFINTVLLRVALEGNPTFDEVLSLVRNASLQAFDHQEVPYSQVLGAMRPWASGDHTPLYRVHFQLRNFPELPVPSRHLKIEEFDPLAAGGSYLSVRARPHGDGLLIQFAADPTRFDRSTIERWAGHFQRLAEGVTEHPTLGVRDHEIIDTAEAARLRGFNTPAPSGAMNPPLAPNALRSRAELTPDSTAIIEGDRTLTFAELDQLIDRVTGHLVQRRVGRGHLVVLFMERGIAAIASMLGVMRAGAAFVPIDTEATSAWLSSVLSDTTPTLILTQRAWLDEATNTGIETVAFEDISETPAPSFTPIALSPKDLAYVLFTSGSTGHPKGVMVEHGNLASFIANSSNHRRIGPGDRVILFHAISFDGCFDSIFVPMVRGATIVVRDRESLASIPRFLAWSDRHGITHMDIPTSFFNVLAADVLQDGLDFPPAVKLVSIGGEQGRAELVARWQRRFGGRIRLANDYGPTETTVWVTTKDVEPEIESMTWLPIGRPHEGCPVYVLDPAGRFTPIGIPGEIHIGGDQVALGYLNRPDLSAERFVGDPWSAGKGARMYRTGDLGRWLADGDLEVLGRIDRQVKIRGYRVEPAEVEEALRRISEVADCAVLVEPDGSEGASLVAYVKMNASRPFDDVAIIRSLTKSLPPFMVPATVLEVSSLSSNVAGKLDGKSLRNARPPSHPDEIGSERLPYTPIEQAIADIWREVLERDVDLDSGFFELGGHSLLAIRVMSRIQAKLGVEVPLAVLFSHPTIELLASAVTARLAADRGPVLDYLLDELEAMSEEEATALLAQFDTAEGGRL